MRKLTAVLMLGLLVCAAWVSAEPKDQAGQRKRHRSSSCPRTRECPAAVLLVLVCLRRKAQQQAAGRHPATSLLLHRHKTQTTARTWIVRTALSPQAAKTTGEGYLLVVTVMPHNTCSLPQAVHTCCCSEPTPAPAPVPTPPPPARKKASVITVGEVKGTVYTSDGRRVASRDGALGDTLFEGDKLGTGQYVEVRR